MYRNPYLDQLLSQEAMHRRAEDRTQTSIDLIGNLPITVTDLIKEEEARKQKLKERAFDESQRERSTKIQEAQEKRAERESNIDRTDTAMSRVATASLFGGQGDPNVQTLPADANAKQEPPVNLPAPANDSGKAEPIPNAPIPTAPIIESQPVPPPTREEVMTAWSTQPHIQVAYERAKAVFENDPTFKAHFKPEELLAMIVHNDLKQRAEQDRLKILREKSDADIDLKKARAEKLRKPVVLRKKGDKDWPVSLNPAQQAVLTENLIRVDKLNKIAAELADGSYDPGLATGIGSKIRNYLHIRNPEDARSLAIIQDIKNYLIREVSGATVTESEIARLLPTLPDSYDDRDTLMAFIDRLREDAANKYNYTIEIADMTKRSPTPLGDRVPPIDPKTGNRGKKPEKSLSELFDEVLEGTD